MKLLRAFLPLALRQTFSSALCVSIMISAAHAQSAKRKNSSPSPSPSPSPVVAKSLSVDEAAFLQNAWTASAAKLKLINLALQNSQSKAVRNFANRQLQEHTQAYNDLKIIAKHYDVRPTPEAADPPEAYQQLSHLHGPEFDRPYLAMTIAMYTKELAATKEAQASVKNGEAKAYVDAEVHRLEGRLQAAKDTLASPEGAKQ